jgi:hypothetical protein
MKSFHFDLGNSNKGPVGFCARVRANSREEALGVLQGVLPVEHELSLGFSPGPKAPAVEYITVYFNPNAVTVRNIDAEEGEDEVTPAAGPTVSKFKWDNLPANREGWDLFDADGVWTIQKLDDPEGVGEDRGVVVPELESDDVAREIVIQKALAGSKYHALALWLEGRNFREDGEVLIPEWLVEVCS